MVADGRSTGLLTREISALYGHLAANLPLSLPVLPIQYGDYAAWERRAVSENAMASQVAYWRDRLAARTRLFAHRGSQQQSAALEFVVPVRILVGLLGVAQQHGTTLFAVVHSCFTIVLAQVAETDDVAIGTDVGARDRLETEHLVGLFVNQVVLRMDVGGADAFTEVLNRATATLRSALSNKDVPFDRVVEQLQPDRGPRAAPIFQAKLVLQEADPPLLDLAGASVTPVSLPRRHAKFDMLLNLVPRDGVLAGYFEYRQSIMTSVEADIFVEQFRECLTIVADESRTRLDELRQRLAEVATRRRAEVEDAAERGTLNRLTTLASSRRKQHVQH